MDEDSVTEQQEADFGKERILRIIKIKFYSSIKKIFSHSSCHILISFLTDGTRREGN